MKAISIRQPWAWLIINAGKDIENRSWPTHLRGRVLVHAAKGMTNSEYEDVEAFIAEHPGSVLQLPPREALERGGIIGSVEIVDCVRQSKSPWFFGPYGFVLRDPKPLAFLPLRGRLGFFDAEGAP